MRELEIRCPLGPQRLLAKWVHEGGTPRIVSPDNLIELHCSDCTRQYRRDGEDVARVLHRYNLAGDLVQTVVVPRDG